MSGQCKGSVQGFEVQHISARVKCKGQVQGFEVQHVSVRVQCKGSVQSFEVYSIKIISERKVIKNWDILHF